VTDPLLQRDRYWQRELRPLPVSVSPLPGELMISYLRRLARANHVECALLIEHLGQSWRQGIGPIQTHDLQLSPAALTRLAILSGCSEKTLIRAIGGRLISQSDSQPAFDWTSLPRHDPQLVRPCSLCAARRGVRDAAIVRLNPQQLPLCLRHSRTLVHYRADRLKEQPLSKSPQVVSAVRRLAILLRRRHAGVDNAFDAADHITSTWRLAPGRRVNPDPISARWEARARFLPGVPDRIVRCPETLALITLFTSRPDLLSVHRGRSTSLSPMQFLLAAALCLSHPMPHQLLRRSHPLFQWAGAIEMPTWWWSNTSEPDKTIYRLLRRSRSHPLENLPASQIRSVLAAQVEGLDPRRTAVMSSL
jgi:hypothetical protein